MFVELLAAAANQGRSFSSVPYDGSGGPFSHPTGVNAAQGALSILRRRSHPVAFPEYDESFYDTVRGAALRTRLNTADEDVSSVLTFSGRNRIMTGVGMNVIGEKYVMWNFAKRAGFLDIVPFSGGSGSVAHALGQTPVFMLVLKRSGTAAGAYHAVHHQVGSGKFSHVSGDFMPVVNASPFTGVGSTVFTPDATYFPAGRTYVAYLFGTGQGKIVSGSYVGTGGTVNTTLQFAPAWFLLWDEQASGTSVVYDPKITGTPGHVGMHWSTLNTPIVNRTLIPFTVVSNVTISATATVLGRTYRYLAVR